MNYHSTSDVPVPYGRVVPKKSTGHVGEEELKSGLRVGMAMRMREYAVHAD